MGITAWIVLGLIAGFIVSIVGGAGIAGFNIWSILVAIFGAIVVLWIYHSVAGRRTVG